MSNTNSTIEIFRSKGVLTAVFVSMPMWTKEKFDGFLSVNLPLLGLKSFAKDEIDADLAVKEVIQCFCVNADRFGKGLEKELHTLGWEIVREDQFSTSLSFKVSRANTVFDSLLETGEQFVQKFDLVECN